MCSAPALTADVPASLTNPILVVDVLSPGTEEHDRGVKLAHYRRLPSIREVALVSVNEKRVEVHRRLDGGQWLITDVESGEIELASVGGTMSVAEIYTKIDALPLDTSRSTATS